MMSQASHLMLVAWFSLVALSVHPQDASAFSDGSRCEIAYPQGLRSFANEVVKIEAGEPNAGPICERPQVAIYPPTMTRLARPTI